MSASWSGWILLGLIAVWGILFWNDPVKFFLFSGVTFLVWLLVSVAYWRWADPKATMMEILFERPRQVSGAQLVEELGGSEEASEETTPTAGTSPRRPT